MQQKGGVLPVVLGLTWGVLLLIAVEMCQHQLSLESWAGSSVLCISQLFKRPFRLLDFKFHQMYYGRDHFDFYCLSSE